MTIVTATAALVLCLAVTASSVRAQCTNGGVLVCSPTSTAPKLDGVFSEWASVPAFSTPLFTYFATEYPDGKASLRCVHDNEKVYFAFEFPGKYRFAGGHLAPAIATMTKIGARASFTNMGGCPNAFSSCDSTLPLPSTCDNYIVDIGAHWETKASKQGVAYPISLKGTGSDAASGKDDEYAVSPFCRRADDGGNAGNEWAGAWTHSNNSTTGASGFYRFELSRLLTTGSTKTDAQYVIGKNFSFGVAFWDPWESDTGYSEPGHYMTGCGASWINLALIAGSSATPPASKPVSVPIRAPTNKPVVAPTKPPTNKPLAAPTSPPTKSPTKPPTKTPVAPTKPPTTKPVVTPTKPPTNKPVAAPTKPPTSNPVAVPTKPPTRKPVAAPAPFPTLSEVIPPTEAPQKPAVATTTVAPKRSKKVRKPKAKLE